MDRSLVKQRKLHPALLEEPNYSDVHISCDGSLYFVHHHILVECSEVLARELQLQSGSSPEHPAIILLSPFDRLTVERLLQWIYKGDYTTSTTNKFGYHTLNEKGTFVVHAGDKGAQPITDLDQSHFSERFYEAATDPAMAHIYVYEIAISLEIPMLKEMALQKLQSMGNPISSANFQKVVCKVCSIATNHNDPLRETLFGFCLPQLDELIKSNAIRRAATWQEPTVNTDLLAFSNELLVRGYSSEKLRRKEEVRRLKDQLSCHAAGNNDDKRLALQIAETNTNLVAIVDRLTSSSGWVPGRDVQQTAVAGDEQVSTISQRLVSLNDHIADMEKEKESLEEKLIDQKLALLGIGSYNSGSESQDLASQQ